MHDEILINMNLQDQSVFDKYLITWITNTTSFGSYVFWLGDLNFRLEPHMTTEAIAKDISSANWEALSEVDELHKAQKSGDAFSMLKEGKLDFPPTYKYVEGTSTYDFS